MSLSYVLLDFPKLEAQPKFSEKHSFGIFDSGSILVFVFSEQLEKALIIRKVMNILVFILYECIVINFFID